MILRILGVALAVWIAFAVLGALLHAAVVMIVLGALVFVGAAVYTAVRNRHRPRLR